VGPDLLEKISSPTGWERLDQKFFGSGQNSGHSDDKEISDQMCAGIFRFPAHVFLFEPGHPFGDMANSISSCVFKPKSSVVFHGMSAICTG
jgi:hypothetical protein